MMINEPISAFAYLSKGLTILTHREIRPFVIVPLLINLIIFIALNIYLFSHMDDLSHWLISFLPEWEWLRVSLGWLISALAIVIVLALSAYSFSFLASIIAAPFNGLLAEKVELLLTGEGPQPESLSKMIPRTLGRELQKIIYFLPRGIAIFIACFVLGFIPILGILAPIIAFAWASWSLCIQYSDYCFDNHQINFHQMRRELGEKKSISYGFGASIALLTLVPILNFFIMPAAVAGGAVYWSQHKAQRAINKGAN